MIARIKESRNIDKDIALARFGAKKDRCTVLIERHTTSAAGHIRRTPILEVTPDGDIREVPAPALKTTIMERFKDQYLDALYIARSGQAFILATLRMHEVIAEAKDRLAIRDQSRADRKVKFQGKRPAA